MTPCHRIFYATFRNFGAYSYQSSYLKRSISLLAGLSRKRLGSDVVQYVEAKCRDFMRE